jgi:kynurenine formamidase
MSRPFRIAGRVLIWLYTAFLVGLIAVAGARMNGRAQTVRAPASAPAPAPADLGTRAVDLTYPFDEHTIYWPTDKSFHWEKTHWGPSPGGYWYASATYAASEHGGTHLDSPIHFGEGQATTEAIPLSRLIAPAVVIDISAAAARDRDATLTAADLEAWEKTHGAIPGGAIVLIRTGWGRFWPDKKQYLGSDVAGDTANLHFPGIGRDAAEWLVARRKPSGVGIDTASLDHGPSRDFITHRILNGAGVYGIENVANLERVPTTGATVIALPMKIKGGSGGPTRIIAILP